MNKKKTVVLGLALMMMMGMVSLAYFTDVKTGTSAVKAGDVSLTDQTVAVDTKLMVPGDTKTLTLKATYTGNVEAKARVRVHSSTESVASTLTEGFVLKDGAGVVATKLAGTITELGANVNAVTKDITVPYTITLLEESTNKYQNATFGFSYEIQVLQADNTTWATIGAGKVVAK